VEFVVVIVKTGWENGSLIFYLFNHLSSCCSENIIGAVGFEE
jgi:hypothetical protein